MSEGDFDMGDKRDKSGARPSRLTTTERVCVGVLLLWLLTAKRKALDVGLSALKWIALGGGGVEFLRYVLTGNL